MFYWQPGKWIQYAIVGAALPWVAGSVLSTDSLVSDVSSRAITAAGGDWAKVQFDGRDAKLMGDAPSQEAADAAAKAIGTTYGVRLVDISGLKVLPPLPPAAPAAAAPAPEPLVAPVISSATLENNLPVVTGTWPEGKAKSLDVTLNDHTFSLGKDPELTSTNGNWTLKLTAPLAEGKFTVTAKDGDGAAASAAAEKPVELVVAPPPPPPAPEPLAAPTIADVKLDGGIPTVTGTWPEGKATSLDVTLDAKVYSLGSAPELTSDKGNWTLKLTAPLAAGPHSVSVQDGDGKQVAMADKPIAIVVEAAAPPEPKPLVAPTVDAPKVEAGKPVVISGTWPAGIASTLSVTLDGAAAKLGKDFNLLTDASGKWTLTPTADLAPGTHEVVVSVAGADGKSLDAKASFDIPAPPPPPKVEAKPAPVPPPAAPTIATVASDSDHPVIKGTWVPVPGSTLQVELDGVTHTLGKDYDLLSDTAGKWTLSPTKPVVNGTYDVVAKVTGPDGQSTVDASKGEVTVNVPPPAPAPAPEKPYDCGAALAQITANFPIRFAFDHADLGDTYITDLGNYAKLLTDKRCQAMHVQVSGHADYLGSEAYNQGLSEKRATMVTDLLQKAGVEASRLSAIGLGKTKPLDPAHSDDARAKNRRAEFQAQ